MNELVFRRSYKNRVIFKLYFLSGSLLLLSFVKFEDRVFSGINVNYGD